MEASREDIELYLNKRNMTQLEAARVISELMVLKQLADEFDSPLIQYLKDTIESNMKQHGKAVLDNVKPDDKFSLTCACGINHDLNKIYYHTYQTVWSTITSIVGRWYKRNEDIVKGARR